MMTSISIDNYSIEKYIKETGVPKGLSKKRYKQIIENDILEALKKQKIRSGRFSIEKGKHNFDF